MIREPLYWTAHRPNCTSRSIMSVWSLLGVILKEMAHVSVLIEAWAGCCQNTWILSNAFVAKLQYLVFADKTYGHDVAKTSFYSVLYGKPTVSHDIMMPTVSKPFVFNTQIRLKDVREILTALNKQRKNNIQTYDDWLDVTFKLWDLVLDYNPFGKQRKATKLLGRFYGPYRLLRIIMP